MCLPSHKVFQNATLSSALTSYHGDLWQIYARWLPDMSERILDFVHNGDKVFHTFIPHFGLEKISLPRVLTSPVHDPYTNLFLSQDGDVSLSAEVDFYNPEAISRMKLYPVSHQSGQGMIQKAPVVVFHLNVSQMIR